MIPNLCMITVTVCCLQVYCLPEGYEVVERSLDDIRYVLDPTFTPAEVSQSLQEPWSCPGLVLRVWSVH